MQYGDQIHNKSKMADGRHIENRFLAISRRHIGRSTRNLEQRWRITCRYRSRDQNCNFLKFKMADGRHFDNSFNSISQPRIIQFWSNLVGRCTFQFPWWTFDNKSKFCKFKMANGRHIENRFMEISGRHNWPINAKYGLEIHNDMPIQETWPKLQFLQIQDGGRPPSWKYLYFHISAVNYPILIKFGTQVQISISSVEIWLKVENFSNSTWRTDAILNIVFCLYLGAVLADLCKFRNGDEESHDHMDGRPFLRHCRTGERLVVTLTPKPV